LKRIAKVYNGVAIHDVVWAVIQFPDFIIGQYSVVNYQFIKVAIVPTIGRAYRLGYTKELGRSEFYTLVAG
jgi:hypothetical protein